MIEVQKLSDSVTAYCYDTLPDCRTFVICIERDARIYVLDTFCGSAAMAPVWAQLRAAGKPPVVINTHFHWDHVWGNCAFRGFPILSHALCRDTLARDWDAPFAENCSFLLGRADPCLPTVTFEDRLALHEDGLLLFHSPGHTRDCVSVFDRRDGTLYAGDNLERPLVYVEQPDLALYRATLEGYLALRPKRIVGGHTLALDETDIISTQHYLDALSRGNTPPLNSDRARTVHEQNVRLLGARPD